MTLVTADLVFAEDRWRANHGFVVDVIQLANASRRSPGVDASGIFWPNA